MVQGSLNPNITFLGEKLTGSLKQNKNKHNAELQRANPGTEVEG